MGTVFLLNSLGAIASTIQPATTITNTIHNQQTHNYDFEDKIPAGTLKNFYQFNEEGFVSFALDANNTFKNFNITREGAHNFWTQNQEEAMHLLRQVNMELGKRGFFSWIGGIAKTFAGAVASAVTGGQIDAVNKFVVNSAHEIADNTIDAVHVLGSAAQIALGAMDAVHGSGDGATNIVEGWSSVVDHLY